MVCPAQSAAQAARTPKLASAAHTLRGEALARRGMLDEAQRAFARAAKDPNALRARLLLGRLLRSRGRHDEAEPHLTALIDAYNEDRLGANRAAGLAYVAMAFTDVVMKISERRWQARVEAEVPSHH